MHIVRLKELHHLSNLILNIFFDSSATQICLYVMCFIVVNIQLFLVRNLSSFFLSSLPSLRPLMDVNYLPLTDMRIARTFCFANGGQALYLSSPTEIQRITYSQEMCDNLQVSAAFHLSVLSRAHFCYLV